MSGLYVPLDVNYQDDPKILRAGALPELVHIRGLALCKRLMTDGVIEHVQLAGLTRGVPGRPLDHVAALIAEGLWEQHERGWFIASWFKRNKTKAQVEASTKRRQKAAVKANHDRWHEDKPSESCPICYPISDDDVSDFGRSSYPPSDPQSEDRKRIPNGRSLHLAGSGLLREFGT